MSLLPHIKNDKIRLNLSSLERDLTIQLGRGIEIDTLYFTKIVKENEYTTYLLELNSYTELKPYFLKFVITQNDREEKIGYIKYIPDSRISFIDPENFTGTIQMLDDTLRVRSENYFINSVEQQSPNSTTSSRGIDGCTSSTRIISHGCESSDNHQPGEPCRDGQYYAFFEIKITIDCPDNWPSYDNSPLPNELVDISGGGGGGGGNNSNPKNPCDLIKKLKNDILFKQKMTNLQTATAYSFEVVSTAYDNPTPDSQPISIYRFLDFSGDISKPQVEYPYYPQIKGIMHSHYQGLLSVYSVTDLEDIYLKLKNPLVTDDLFSALVTKAGTRYLISISNRVKFIAFGDEYLLTLKKQEKLAIQYEKYNIDKNSTNSTNELGLMKMLTQLDVGVNVYKGNANFTDWQLLTYSSNTNKVIEIPCN